MRATKIFDDIGSPRMIPPKKTPEMGMIKINE